MTLSRALLGSGAAALALPIHDARNSSATDLASLASQSLLLNLEFDFSGQVAMSGCSGSIVRFASNLDANAVLMTNGHCVGMIDADAREVRVNRSMSLIVSAFVNLNHIVQVRTKRLIYATMYLTDVAFVELEETYAALEKKGVRSFEMAQAPARAGDSIIMASGDVRRVQSCSLLGTVHQLREDKWTWNDSYKYMDCHSWHGTSGSPLIDAATGRVIGINNTHQDRDQMCAYDNPCEVDAAGGAAIAHDMSYGQQTYMVTTCVSATGALDSAQPGCVLPQPAEQTP